MLHEINQLNNINNDCFKRIKDDFDLEIFVKKKYEITNKIIIEENINYVEYTYYIIEFLYFFYKCEKINECVFDFKNVNYKFFENFKNNKIFIQIYFEIVKKKLENTCLEHLFSMIFKLNHTDIKNNVLKNMHKIMTIYECLKKNNYVDDINEYIINKNTCVFHMNCHYKFSLYNYLKHLLFFDNKSNNLSNHDELYKKEISLVNKFCFFTNELLDKIKKLNENRIKNNILMKYKYKNQKFNKKFKNLKNNIRAHFYLTKNIKITMKKNGNFLNFENLSIKNVHSLKCFVTNTNLNFDILFNLLYDKQIIDNFWNYNYETSHLMYNHIMMLETSKLDKFNNSVKINYRFLYCFYFTINKNSINKIDVFKLKFYLILILKILKKFKKKLSKKCLETLKIIKYQIKKFIFNNKFIEETYIDYDNNHYEKIIEF